MMKNERFLEVYRNVFYLKPYLENSIKKELVILFRVSFLTNTFAFIKTTCCTIITIIFIDTTSNRTWFEYTRLFWITTKKSFTSFTCKYTEMVTGTNIITYSTRFRFVLRFYEIKIIMLLFRNLSYSLFHLEIFSFYLIDL